MTTSDASTPARPSKRCALLSVAVPIPLAVLCSALALEIDQSSLTPLFTVFGLAPLVSVGLAVMSRVRREGAMLLCVIGILLSFSLPLYGYYVLSNLSFGF